MSMDPVFGLMTTITNISLNVIIYQRNRFLVPITVKVYFLPSFIISDQHRFCGSCLHIHINGLYLLSGGEFCGDGWCFGFYLSCVDGRISVRSYILNWAHSHTYVFSFFDEKRSPTQSIAGYKLSNSRHGAESVGNISYIKVVLNSLPHLLGNNIQFLCPS